MKKNVLKGFAFAMIVAFFVSCAPGVESLVSDFEKACNAGDMEKAEKIATKLEEKEDQLTDEQQERIEAASLQLFLQALGADDEDEE